MQLGRRNFFGAITTAVIGLAIAPKQLIFGGTPVVNKQWAISKYLGACYNEFCRGKRGQYPSRIYVSKWLYTAYEGELEARQRFVSTDDLLAGNPSLLFKMSSIRIDPTLTDIQYRMEV